MKQSKKSALVVLSGGQDSVTCLFWAKQRFASVHAITFDYGQRHKIEIEAARQVATMADVTTHEVIVLPVNTLLSTSPLVDTSTPVEHYAGIKELPGGIEKTFVPCRNALFLTLAVNRACYLKLRDIVLGVSEEDYGGYPDCRIDFVNSMQDALSRAVAGNETKQWVKFHTPLMFLSKKQTVKLAQKLEGCMETLAYSHTCYDGQYPPNPHNHASILRAKGFHEAKVADPLILRAKQEALLSADYPDDGLVEGTPYALKS